MKIELKPIRESYGLTKAQFASIIGLKELFYSQYEERGELPSKYVYVLWKNLDNFPIPEDFFHFTSFTLTTNMKYHNMTQAQIAKFFDISNQSTISGYLSDNIPMYEKKECFLKFDPFILPVIAHYHDGECDMEEIRDLVPKGNFILVEKRRIQKERRIEKAKNDKAQKKDT